MAKWTLGVHDDRRNHIWEFNGNIQAVTEAAFQSAGEAVSLCITMLGIMSFWTGILKIGERAGVIEALTRKMTPLIHFLFPELPCGHPAVGSISANLIANVLGLGWAASHLVDDA